MGNQQEKKITKCMRLMLISRSCNKIIISPLGHEVECLQWKRSDDIVCASACFADMHSEETTIPFIFHFWFPPSDKLSDGSSARMT